MPDSTLSTLQQIIRKIRRLTRSPSQSQLSDATIGEYINTFVLYDFPESIKSDTLKTTFTFYTEPNEDKYSSSDIPDHPLYNFNNKYLRFSSPVYIAGKKSEFYESRELFYNAYPLISRKTSIATGDGATLAYNGTLTNIPVLSNNVLFSSKTIAGVGLAVYDDGEGNLSGDCNPGGTIDYVTGEYAFTFILIPGDGEEIYSQNVQYTPTRPTSILYFKNTFYLRPVPDGVYRVQLEAFTRPTELLNLNQSPDLAEWWQYIAYGAAKKVFEDRMDDKSLSIIAAEFSKQENLILSRTVAQQSGLRTTTIYSTPTSTGGDWKTNPY